MSAAQSNEAVCLGHQTAHPGAAHLCDAVRNGIANNLGLIVDRKQSKQWCGFSIPGQSQFATLTHRKTSPRVNIYARLPLSACSPFESLHVKEKPATSSAYSGFRIQFNLDHAQQLPDACELLAQAARLLSPNVAPTPSDYPDELPRFALLEGTHARVTVNAYERNPEARSRCIAHYGARCEVCALEFQSRYGVIARGLIHVHHLRSLSSIGEEYEVDPIEDLRPVCPNCHAVIHRRVPPYEIEEVRAMLLAMSVKPPPQF